MVRRVKKTQFCESDVISASEIGQYYYCPVAWYLQKCGYESKSPFLEIGIKKHVKHGDVIDYTQNNVKKSKFLATAGYILLIIVVIITIFEVILLN